MTCAQGLLRLLWGGNPKLECYGTDATIASLMDIVRKLKLFGKS